MEKITQIKNEIEQFNKETSDFLARFEMFEVKMKNIKVLVDVIKTDKEKEILPLIEQQRERLKELRSLYLFMKTGFNLEDKVFFTSWGYFDQKGILVDYDIDNEITYYVRVCTKNWIPSRRSYTPVPIYERDIENQSFHKDYNIKHANI